MSAPHNPSAFPVIVPAVGGGTDYVDSGATLRDLFAGLALAGDMASQNEFVGLVSPDATDASLQLQAALYYRLADAMLREREQ